MVTVILSVVFIIAFWLGDDFDGFLVRTGKSLIWVAVLYALGFGVASCHNSDSQVAERAATAAKEARDRTPRVYSEADGCTVYQFKAGDRWSYFTKCPGRVTTEVPYTVRSGKTSKTETQSITTESP